jgi:hypothetical protein
MHHDRLRLVVAWVLIHTTPVIAQGCPHATANAEGKFCYDAPTSEFSGDCANMLNFGGGVLGPNGMCRCDPNGGSWYEMTVHFAIRPAPLTLLTHTCLWCFTGAQLLRRVRVLYRDWCRRRLSERSTTGRAK